MKGTNTIIVNADQMNVIVDKWWSGMTYGTAERVIDVTVDANGNFEITLDEVVSEEKD